MNVRLTPKHFVATGQHAWFVDGHTSDDPSHWVLTVATVNNGQIDISTATDARGIVSWVGTPWEGELITARQINQMALLIGNVQRRLKNIPVLVVQ